MRWTRGRTYAVVGLMALAGMAIAVIPALGDSQPEVLRLHMSGSEAHFEYEGSIQPITARNCVIDNPADADSGATPPIAQLMDLGATESKGKPGFKDNSIGIKTGGSQGVPCSRVAEGEPSLVLTVNETGPVAGREFGEMRLDLELKDNAWVIVTMRDAEGVVATHELVSGSRIAEAEEDLSTVKTNEDGYYIATTTDDDLIAPCADPADSGPDSNSNDNCLWTIQPGSPFTSITLEAKFGEFSLEGGGDYEIPGYDTLFFLANAVPTASDVSESTDENTPVEIDITSDVDDPDDDPLTVTVEPAKDDEGNVITKGEISVDGLVITYDPNGQFEALNVDDTDPETDTDSFTFTVDDGKGGSATATVNMTITGVNDAPVVKNSTASGDEDTTISVALDITDPDDTSFTTTCTPEDGDDDQPLGSFTANATGTGGTYTPPDDFNGAVTLTCTVEDSGGKSDTGTVKVTVSPVNDAPVANDDTFYVDDDAGSTVVDPTINDTDIENDSLTVTEVTNVGEDFETRGSVSVDADGEVTYTPPTDFTGSDTFLYTVSDGNGGSDSAMVTIEEVIQCGESLTAEDGDVWARYLRIDDSDVVGACIPKPYDLEIIEDEFGEPVVKFVPREPLNSDGEPQDAPARFSAELSFEPLVATDNAGGGDDSNLEYDPDAVADNYELMQWCVNSTLEFDVDGGELVEVRVTNATLPVDETWCIAYKRTYVEGTPDGDVVRTVWTVYGEGDPFKRLS